MKPAGLPAARLFRLLTSGARPLGAATMANRGELSLFGERTLLRSTPAMIVLDPRHHILDSRGLKP
jgi:hypothetical protein